MEAIHVGFEHDVVRGGLAMAEGGVTSVEMYIWRPFNSIVIIKFGSFNFFIIKSNEPKWLIPFFHKFMWSAKGISLTHFSFSLFYQSARVYF